MASNLLGRSGFERIHNELYIHTPATSHPTSKTIDPDTIVYFPGFNAIPKTIVKYTNHYQQLYPHSRIILCLSNFSDIVRHTPGRKDPLVSPAIDILNYADSNSKTLIHICSNGGAYMFREFAAAYRRKAGEILALDMLVLDSTPGLHDFWRNLFAFQTALPRFFVFYYIGSAVALIYMMLLHIWMAVTGSKPLVEEVWETLNDTELVDARAQRLYLWSKTDEFIDWHDVKLHSGIAKRRNGCRVKMVEFPGGKHCAHVLVDKDKYWNAIKQTWDECHEHGSQEWIF